MCPDYKIGLNETRLGLVVPKFLSAAMLNTISKREAEKALTLGTLYSTEEARKVSVHDFYRSILEITSLFSDWTHR